MGQEFVSKAETETYRYEIVPGFFLNDDPGIKAKVQRVSLPDRMGLLDESAERWSTFRKRVEHLRNNAGENVQFKALFIGRHGEGFHNVADAKYGKEAWENYWTKKNTDGKIVWGLLQLLQSPPDAELTGLGIQQAEQVNALWKKELAYNIPIPDMLFSSTLIRAVHTCLITFGDMVIDSGDRRPLVIEMLREVLGVCTCDKRGRLSDLKARFPCIDLEEGLPDEDGLWTPAHRETLEEQVIREHKAFDTMFNSKNVAQTYISVTCHSRTIAAILAMLGRECIWIPTGGILAFVIKATRV